MTKTKLAIIISFFTSFSLASELTKLNASWLHQSETTITQNLRASSDLEAMPIINTLGSIWQNRDGALGSEVSPYIANALIYKSNIMLAWFDKHPNELESWLQQIENSLFTNYSGSAEYTVYLIKLKTQLVNAMSSYSGSFKSMAGKILAAISQVHIREID